MDSTGTLTVNVLPLPTSLSTLIDPTQQLREFLHRYLPSRDRRLNSEFRHRRALDVSCVSPTVP